MSTQINFKMMVFDPKIPSNELENLMDQLKHDLEATAFHFFIVRGIESPQVAMPSPEIVFLA